MNRRKSNATTFNDKKRKADDILYLELTLTNLSTNNYCHHFFSFDIDNVHCFIVNRRNCLTYNYGQQLNIKDEEKYVE